MNSVTRTENQTTTRLTSLVRASCSRTSDCRCGQQLDLCARAHCPRCGRSISRSWRVARPAAEPGTHRAGAGSRHRRAAARPPRWRA